MSEQVFVGLGSNLGDRQSFIERAIALLEATPGIELLALASLYETEPVGYKDQPMFLNTVVEIRSYLSAQKLLARLKEIERQLGRKKRERWGPREIDLDLLLYGEQIIEDSELKIPHPELHRRRFVLVPLVEIAPEVIHPKLGQSLAELLAQLTEEKGVRVLRRDQRKRLALTKRS